MKLTWEMQRVDPTQQGLLLSIHFKDNKKVSDIYNYEIAKHNIPMQVKSKKRWSQVMYMSYVLDFFIKEEQSGKRIQSITFQVIFKNYTNRRKFR